MRYFFFFGILMLYVSIHTFPGDHITLTCIKQLPYEAERQSCIFYETSEWRII